jgi:hypothetical protein
VRIFYATKIRAHLGWWKAQHAPRSILRALKHGVKLDFHTLTQPFNLSPLLVDNHDVDFAIADLQKGDSLGAYQPLLPGGENFLSRTRIDTQVLDKSPSLLPHSAGQIFLHEVSLQDQAQRRTVRKVQSPFGHTGTAHAQKR